MLYCIISQKFLSCLCFIHNRVPTSQDGPDPTSSMREMTGRPAALVVTILDRIRRRMNHRLYM